MPLLAHILGLTALRRLVVVCVVVGCLGSTAAFAYLTATSSPGTTDPTATAASMPAGSAPTASVSGKTVTLNFSQVSVNSQFVGAYTSGGYTVRRYATSGGVQSTISTGTCSSSVSGATSTLSCSETNVPDGSWTYTVTPTLYSWTGAESSKAVTSAQVTVATATLDHFVVSAPSSSTAGSAFNVTVTAQDASNNTLTGYVGTVHFTSTDAGTSKVLPGNYSFVAADNGTHTFTNGVTLTTSGSQTVSVNDTVSTAKTGTSSAISVSPATANKLAFVGQPTATVATQTITPALTVAIQDTFGNVINSTSNVTLGIGTNPATGTLSGTVVKAAIAGVATFNDLSIDKAASGYTLNASSPGLAGATSNPFAINVGAASKLAFTQSPSSSTGGIAFGTQPKITVQDAGGNTVTSSSASITLAIGTNPGPGALSGTTTILASSGVATFSGLAIDKAATGYTLTGASSGLTGATSNTFNVTVGGASKLAFTQQPSSNTVSSTAFTTQPRVAVQDAGGNTVTTDTSLVSIAITSGTGTLGAALSCTNNPLAAVAGLATFAQCKVDKAGVGYTLTATDSGLSAATSTSFTITAGTATKLALSAATTSPIAGAADNLTITAQDAAGNTATGYAGDKILTFSGSTAINGNSPTVSDKSGALKTFSVGTTITFTSGIASATGANNGVMKLYKAGSAAIIVSDSSIGNGAGLSVTVVPATQASLVWTSPAVNNGSLSSPCLVTCTWTGAGRGKTWTSSVSITDAYGNIVNDVGSNVTINFAVGGDSTSGWASATKGVSPTNAATTLTSNTFTTDGSNSWNTATLTAHLSNSTTVTDATATVNK
jgi:hypothetical protein